MANTHRDKGASLVEFAVVAPLLFLLLFGVIEFGRAIATHTAVTTAAREAARFATTVGTGDEAIPPYADCDAIRAAAFDKTPLLDTSQTDIDLSYDNGEDCAGAVASGTIENGDRIEVVVTTTFRTPIPVISNIIGDIEISSRQQRTIYPGSST